MEVDGDVVLAVVSDDVPKIQEKLKEWTDGESPAHVVFTTGGTGFGVRSVFAASGGPPPAVEYNRWMFEADLQCCVGRSSGSFSRACARSFVQCRGRVGDIRCEM